MATGAWTLVLPHDGSCNKEGTTGCPVQRRQHSSVVIGGLVVVFGGADHVGSLHVLLNDVWSLDFAQKQWTRLHAYDDACDGTTCPRTRRGHAAAAIGGKMVVFGGYQDGGAGYLDDTWSFDVYRREWTEVHAGGGGGVSACPSARHYPSLVAAGSELIVGAGEGTLPSL